MEKSLQCVRVCVCVYARLSRLDRNKQTGETVDGLIRENSSENSGLIGAGFTWNIKRTLLLLMLMLLIQALHNDNEYDYDEPHRVRAPVASDFPKATEKHTP